jgi:hypothetical protein
MSGSNSRIVAVEIVEGDDELAQLGLRGLDSTGESRPLADQPERTWDFG